VAIALHLNNREAQKELKLKIGDKHIANEVCAKYLGVRIARSLTFKKHLEDVKNKLKSRNNIISKLAGVNWGSNTKVLRISAIALVYSVAEYCAPVWARSAHCHKVDTTELNHTMRIMTSTVKPTLVQWLPTLANIAPPDLRRLQHTERLIQKITKHPEIPLHNDFTAYPPKRLKSRHPIWDLTPTKETMVEI